MRRKTSGEGVDLRVEGTITTIIVATVEVVSTVAVVTVEEAEGGKGSS